MSQSHSPRARSCPRGALDITYRNHNVWTTITMWAGRVRKTLSQNAQPSKRYSRPVHLRRVSGHEHEHTQARTLCAFVLPPASPPRACSRNTHGQTSVNQRKVTGRSVGLCFVDALHACVHRSQQIHREARHMREALKTTETSSIVPATKQGRAVGLVQPSAELCPRLWGA